jgi:PIN domain nuclease of toxin-antitoxin system
MRLLLDTHAFLWFIMGSANLSANARARIEDPASEILLSVASLWKLPSKQVWENLRYPPLLMNYFQHSSS